MRFSLLVVRFANSVFLVPSRFIGNTLVLFMMFGCALRGEPSWAAPRETRIHPVVLSATQAPGLDAGVQFFNFSYPQLNDDGEVAFSSYLAGPGITRSNDHTIWRTQSAIPQLVAREGQLAAASDQQVVLSTIIAPASNLNNHGQSTFTGEYVDQTGQGNPRRALWKKSPGTPLNAFARIGGPAVGLGPNAVFDGDMSRPEMNNTGEIAFSAQFIDPLLGGQMRGVWVNTPSGELNLIDRSGRLDPITGETITLDTLSGDLKFSDNGTVAYTALLTNASSQTRKSINVSLGGEPARSLLRVGDHLDSVSPGATVASLDLFDINSVGHLLAFVVLKNVPGCPNCDSLGTLTPEGSFRPVARERTPAPGVNGAVFSEIGLAGLAPTGQVYFEASISGPGINTTNDSGLWAELTPGQLVLVAREGDVAPGSTAGLVFEGVGFSNLRMLNNGGQIAFNTRLTNPNSSIPISEGIWTFDGQHGLRPVVLVGDLLPDWRGSYRPITDLAVGVGTSGSPDGGGTWFNNNGQIAFAATLSNGNSGVYISDPPVVVPEPTTSQIAAIGLCVVISVSMRKHRPANAAVPTFSVAVR